MVFLTALVLNIFSVFGLTLKNYISILTFIEKNDELKYVTITKPLRYVPIDE